jgi:arylsulfatase
MLFSADETTDLGSDSATPVTDDLASDELEFNGRVQWVEIDLGEDAEDSDHLITPEERYRIAMARQ